ncbi:MAG TPA: serine/threonine-protein kinase, partial [Thermoanaerobaculia bacterium]|nr:serine/threonine-protein kinase [Thermoanaerobaculia bacterium]
MSDSSDSGRRAVRTPPPATGGRTGSSGGARAGSGGSSGSGGRSGRIAPPLFADGEIVGERYRIIRFIGRGGMGEVYQTEDLDLDVEVALKTVRPEIAEHEKALERFRREIQLARKVTHPNVCRIFDVGRHLVTTDKEEPFEILFLTMELLRGETLAEHLRSEGPIPSGSALPILTQLASGLAAAHAAGIVHRDFKSSNVVLVRPEGGEVRAVITDFGLARGIHPEDTLTSSLSVSSQPVGTPTYMAPEQVAGREVTTATDIYAFGVVMYEMLTGVPPFVGDSPLSTAV